MKVNSSEREDRLARALRENLRRRKARDRALEKGDAEASAMEPEPRPNKAGNGE
jgi:hypothetical protein